MSMPMAFVDALMLSGQGLLPRRDLRAGSSSDAENSGLASVTAIAQLD